MRRTFEAEDYKSKSQMKREADAIQKIVRPLIGLTPQNLKRLPLSEHILDAILKAQGMQQGALKRQVLFISGLLREEEDLSDLYKALTAYFK